MANIDDLLAKYPNKSQMNSQVGVDLWDAKRAVKRNNESVTGCQNSKVERLCHDANA